MSRGVEVSAPSRLHFGLVNPHGVAPYRLYGSAGVAVKSPRVVVEVYPSDRFELPPVLEEGEKATLVSVLRGRGVRGVRAVVREVPPRHAGFGTTTQLLLSIAVGALRLHGIEYSPLDLAWELGRGRVSSIGVYSFMRGGFIVDAGRGRSTRIAPLALRLDFPEEWRFVLILPRGTGLSGEEEEKAMKAPKFYEVARVHEAAWLLHYGLVPAVIERDPSTFAEALGRLQELVGGFFQEEQGGLFNPASAKVVEHLEKLGVRGYGQSSWGPLIYVFAESEDRAREIADSVSRLGEFRVCVTGADNRGAVVREV
ncbi:MAG: beta-ribofuranosylaminobenzene 5'-phosphate synthase family protein [Thermogladius sp.]